MAPQLKPGNIMENGVADPCAGYGSGPPTNGAGSVRPKNIRIRIRNTDGKACASDLDPFVIRESGPDVVWLRDGGLVRLQDDLCPVVVHVQRSQDQDQPARTDISYNLYLFIRSVLLEAVFRIWIQGQWIRIQEGKNYP